jgi:hypothetical protein
MTESYVGVSPAEEFVGTVDSNLNLLDYEIAMHLTAGSSKLANRARKCSKNPNYSFMCFWMIHHSYVRISERQQEI